MTRVLLVSPSAKPGGAERALASLARHLPAHGFEPTAAVLEPGEAVGWFEAAGCPATVVEEAGLAEEGGAALLGLLRCERPDVVVSNKWNGHRRGGAAAAAEGIPAVWWQHDRPGRSPRELEAAAVPAAAIVCPSDYVIRAQRLLTPAATIAKVHTGVPVGAVAAYRGSGAALRRALGWNGHPVVGIVGRLERWKGQKTFLRAARLVSERHPDARYAVVGGAILGNEGSYPDDLRTLAAELGLAGRVHFTGHQDDAYPWFDALDVVVHASDGEPFGLVVVEAMALGKAIVSTRPGGPVEIIEEGVSGLLVPPRRPTALSEAVLRLLDEPGLAPALGAGAVQRSMLFSEERMTAEFGAILRDVLA